MRDPESAAVDLSPVMGYLRAHGMLAMAAAVDDAIKILIAIPALPVPCPRCRGRGSVCVTETTDSGSIAGVRCGTASIRSELCSDCCGTGTAAGLSGKERTTPDA
jgi:RecJ-like exonuclease